jgi:predicted amidohydrolase
VTADGWSAQSPRDEIRPQFRVDPTGGYHGGPALSISTDAREGLDGSWVRAFPITGGKTYAFHCVRKLEGAAVPRRSALVRISWTDADGKKVARDEAPTDGYRKGFAGPHEAEHPQDGPTDAAGWTEVRGIYRAPSKATQAVVELHLQWAANASIAYSDVQLSETTPPPPRTARLATIHFQPHGGKSPQGNCELFAPLIAEAARQKADLVVLPETLTFYGLKKTYEECSEPVPGPSTEYFGKLAKEHDLYVVAGLIERDKHLIYNVAVLIGPDGKIVGKYRKVSLPRSEVENGVAPGNEYPVFDTRFGKVGMMICYDGFFPEVARQLANNGAEVIAWPVWGCNPLLAQARACENHVYLVSSTYTPADGGWIRSAVYGHSGAELVAADKFGTVVTAEVDLNKPMNWNSLGDFRGQLLRHRPVWTGKADE